MPQNLSGITNSAGQPAPWIELVNTGTTLLGLSNYTVVANKDDFVGWMFPVDATIAPGQTLLIFADGRPELSGASELHTSFSLSPSNGVVYLRNTAAFYQVIDYVNYTNVPSEFSYGSYPDGQSLDRAWFDHPTPGASNRVPVQVTINEWMASNPQFSADPADNDFDDWFELFNANYVPMDISGYYLTDLLTNRNQWRIPNGTILPARGHLVVWADGELDQNNPNGGGDLHVPFKLSGNGEAIGLFAPDLTTVDAITFGPQTDNISQGRYPDGSTNLISLMTMPTPGAANDVVPTATNQVIPSMAGLAAVHRFTLPGSPAELLCYRLGPDAPPAATIDSARGVFVWNLPPNLPPGYYRFNLLVSDIRPGAGVQQVPVTVRVEPLLQVTDPIRAGNGLMSFGWTALSGLTYRVEYRDTVLGDAWTNYGPSLTATSAQVHVTIPLQSVERYFRVLRVP